MNNIRHILVSVDSQKPDSAELKRAMTIAKYSGAALHIVDGLRDLNVAARFMPQWQEAHEKWPLKSKRRCNNLPTSAPRPEFRASAELLRGVLLASFAKGHKRAAHRLAHPTSQRR